MGYAQSKLVGERILSLAWCNGARAYSLRIGQVSGHSKKGLWNDSEAIPLMVRSSLILKSLPEPQSGTSRGGEASGCSWLPVDMVAATIVELAKHFSTLSLTECSTHAGDASIYNVYSLNTFLWTSFLADLEQGGFEFEVVSSDRWLEALRLSEARGRESINPAVKLIDHYRAMLAESKGPGEKRFRTDKAEKDSITLRDGRLSMVEDGILARYVSDWLDRWTHGSGNIKLHKGSFERLETEKIS